MLFLCFSHDPILISGAQGEDAAAVIEVGARRGVTLKKWEFCRIIYHPIYHLAI